MAKFPHGVLAAAMFLVTGTALGQPFNNRVIIVQNVTDAPARVGILKRNVIAGVWIKPTNDYQWGPNLFAEFVSLAPGDRVTLTVPGPACLVDFKVVWNDNYEMRHVVDICSEPARSIRRE